jgi:DNA primase
MAGRLPEQFIDDLMARIDIVEIIDARVALRKAGREYVACCPFHREKTPSFTVSPEKQFYHCFGCGAHGTAIGFVMEYEHLDFIEAVTDLAARVGLPLPREASVPAPGGHGELYAVLTQADRYFRQQLREHPSAGRATEYLKKRGLTGAIAAQFGIGYAPPARDGLLRAMGGDATRRAVLLEAGLIIRREDGGEYDRFRDRVMFPIRDRRGRVVGFGGRVLGEGTPKYLNSPETPVFHKGRELYGYYEARHALRRIERLLVVEGYMDVVALAQHGIAYAVATLGTATSRDHLERIFRTTEEAVFCFDGDRAGREAAWRALETALPLMQEGRQARFLFLPEGEDPDSLVRRDGAGALEARLADAQPLSVFLFQELAGRTDMASMDGRARLVELARPLLSKVPEGVYRQMLMDRLAEIAHIEAGKLSMLIGGRGGSASERAMPRARSVKGTQRQPPSAVRLAIALLLQEPELAARAGDPQRFRGLTLPGADVLIELLELLRARPGIGPGAILEHWRDAPRGEQLMKIARWHEPAPREGIERQFEDTLMCLGRQAREQRWTELQEKLQREGLSAEETAEWQQLLQTGDAAN